MASMEHLDKNGDLVFRVFSGNTTVTIDAMHHDGKFSRVFVPHDEMLQIVAELKKDIARKKKEHAKNLRTRDASRNTVCSGCRHNYYNFGKPHDSVGVGVADNYYCWSIPNVKRGKCPAKG